MVVGSPDEYDKGGGEGEVQALGRSLRSFTEVRLVIGVQHTEARFQFHPIDRWGYLFGGYKAVRFYDGFPSIR